MMIKDCQQVGICKDGDDYGDIGDNDVTINLVSYNVGLLKNCELIPSIVFLHCNIAISEYRGIVLAKQYRVHCSTLQRNAVSRLRNGTICQNG